jgi:hypothetical protein
VASMGTGSNGGSGVEEVDEAWFESVVAVI